MGIMRCIFRWSIGRTNTEKTLFGAAFEALIPAMRQSISFPRFSVMSKESGCGMMEKCKGAQAA
jgi:hypothetical protein